VARPGTRPDTVFVAFPTNRDNRAQVELVTHGRAFYRTVERFTVAARARIPREFL
jgi:hypothetical protein